jgi:flagellar biosynthesis/type III secretory pathway protein FliH
MTALNTPARACGMRAEHGAVTSWQSPSWAEAAGVEPRNLRDVLKAGGEGGVERQKRDTVFREAYEEGMHNAMAAGETIMERYHQAILELEMIRDRILGETERDIVELSVMVAEQALAGEPIACRAFTEKMVEHALKVLREADAITLRVSPTDGKALMSKHPELMNKHAVVRVVEDPTITLGGVVAECNFGRVDASLQRRLVDAAQALRDGLPLDAKLADAEVER